LDLAKEQSLASTIVKLVALGETTSFTNSETLGFSRRV